jgi:RHO1 GDP-GTP exchange protein 1/2
VQHPDAHTLDMKGFINRPILQLLRYDELLRAILDQTPRGHEDHGSIPPVLDVIKALGHDTEPGVHSAKQKVKLWGFNAGLVFKRGETIVSSVKCSNEYYRLKSRYREGLGSPS